MDFKVKRSKIPTKEQNHFNSVSYKFRLFDIILLRLCHNTANIETMKIETVNIGTVNIGTVNIGTVNIITLNIGSEKEKKSH